MVIQSPESCVLMVSLSQACDAWGLSARLGGRGAKFAVGTKMLYALVSPHAFGFLAHGREHGKGYVYSQCELCTARRGDA